MKEMKKGRPKNSIESVDTKTLYRIRINFSGEVKTFYRSAYNPVHALGIALRAYEGSLGRVSKSLWKSIYPYKDKWNVEIIHED